MIKSHKRGMLALIDTMQKMADLLPKLAEPSEQIQDILAACQCLRENLSEEKAMESLILLQSIEDTVKTDNYPSLFAQIKNLESKFKTEVKTKKEVLFLPYKASMWDSLESIYLAAKEDPDCEALVMPIPYYDKKDGKFTDMHWEISYPKNIPLIDYRKYNIEERRPDIIFIHNPYDDLNIVTSVHPNYFSQKLRNLTDCLVYVPYFVTGGNSVGKHFCTLPGCIYAHKVIAQTELEREIYVKEYKLLTRESGDKFLVLGSPKLDKVINAKLEDFEIPDEWKRLIAGKKVIFYGLSIGSLLTYSVENNKPSNKYLQKVKKVFEFFKNRKDAVLLWRPHPLLEGTIKSMRPWLQAEYAEIVSEFKNGKYGIYDDTEDLNRAIAMSDMYYGDGSSVTNLFQAANKPVLCQSFGVLFTSGFFEDENYIWILDLNNTLYKHNKQSCETEYVGTIPGQNSYANSGMAMNSNKLYFAPFWWSDEVSVFDTDKNIFERIEFKNDCEVLVKFRDVASYKNFVYFIPYRFPAIMKLNTDTNEIDYYKVSQIFSNFCVADDELALIINESNSVMLFNMETGKHEIKSIAEKAERYGDICFDGQDYYLTSLCNNHIVKWNRKSNKISKIKIPVSAQTNSLIQYLNEHIWLFTEDKTFKINPDANSVAVLPKLVEHFGKKSLAAHCVNTGELFIKDFEDKETLDFWLSKGKLNETAAKAANSGERIWEAIK